MATNTTKLNLPRPDASDNFNRAAYNGLIDAIDANVGAKLDAKIETSKAGAANGVATLDPDGKVPASQLNISAPTDASTTQKGVVQLSSATDSTSEVSAATSKAVKDAKDGLATQIGILSGQTAILDDKTNDYKTAKSNKDANGIFTTITYRRKSDNSLYATSVLSGGTSPSYTTRTLTYYEANGTTVRKTVSFTLSYDVDGALVSEV